MKKKPPAAAPDDAVHRAKMQALQSEMRAKVRAASTAKGLIIVHCGNGKGKTTAAFGMLARMLGRKRKCAVIQFIKTGGDPVARLLRGPLLQWHRVGRGFTWDTQDRAADVASCRRGWTLACRHLADPTVDFVLLDELNVVLSFDYLPLEEVLTALRDKRADQHVVLTGRNPPPALLELADLVTEMREVKHPFNAGIKAQPGIDY
jgi:cob(I)alamin adenosyltransferase